MNINASRSQYIWSRTGTTMLLLFKNVILKITLSIAINKKPNDVILAVKVPSTIHIGK